MTRSTVVADRRLYNVSGLEPRARGQIFQAIVIAQLVDDLTDLPVAGSVRVASTMAGLSPRTAASGFVGLTGQPTRALPGLDTAPYGIDLVIETGGYAPRHEHVDVPIQPGFPSTFTASDLGVLRMRRTPSIVGLITYALDPKNRPLPLPGVAVSATGSWARIDQLGQPPATTPLVAIAPGLSAVRPSTATVDVPALTLPAEPARTLIGSASVGATTIVVTNTGALAVGDLVGLDLADPDRAERIEIVGVDGAADLTSPAEIELRFPLVNDHADHTSVERISAPGGAPPSAVLSTDAFEGDRTLAVSTLAGLGVGQVVRISGGTSAPEYRTADLYEITTDADGFGRLPPISGLAAVAVEAVSGALSTHARVTLTQSAPALDLTLT